MKKILILSVTLFSFIANVQAIKVKFTVVNMSVNTAEGTMGIFTSFQVYPNNYNNPNSLELVDFPTIKYKDIDEMIIEKIWLSEKSKTSFSQTAVFPVTDNTTFGNKTNTDFIQGNTYVFKLSVMTKSGQKLNLLNKSSSTQLPDPKMNCAKFNNVYRLAGHNNFQESVISPQNGGFYQTMYFTRIVELDVHASNNSTTWNWDVRHIGSGNKNNCGHTSTDGDKPFGTCIDDLKTWHNDNPNHDVIILFIDLKSEWNENNNNQTPADLDQKLLSLVPDPDMIYKPKDLLGNNLSSNSGNMRLAAQQNNWPSMSDLTGKLMFVLTGDGGKISHYIADRSLGAVAFSAASVKSVIDVLYLPDIWAGLKNDIVFYNIQLKHIDNNVGNSVSALGYVSRTWGTIIGFPKHFNNNEYADAIDESINNIATKLVWDTPSPTNGKTPNGIQIPVKAENPIINNSRIYSTYENVTQAATQTITATNLIVEPGAHYRMIAGQRITLEPGVEFKVGSDVNIRIDNCSNVDNNLRNAAHEQLTQEQIDGLMHELDKDLFGYTPEDENKIVSLRVYPNPTNEIVNISYTNYLLTEALFTLYDLTGRVVISKIYSPQNKGIQKFSLNINALKNGTYFYTLRAGAENHKGKIVKISN